MERELEGQQHKLRDEVNRLGGDNPNTVIVPKGTSFDILVTEAIAMTM